MIKRIRTAQKKTIRLGDNIESSEVSSLNVITKKPRNLLPQLKWTGFAKQENVGYWIKEGWHKAIINIKDYDQQIKTGFCDRLTVDDNVCCLVKGNEIKFITSQDGEYRNLIKEKELCDA